MSNATLVSTIESAAPVDGLVAAPPESRATQRILRALIPVIFLAAWEVASRRNELVPGIGETVRALFQRFDDGSIAPELTSTLQAVFCGYGLASLVGLTIGFPLGRSAYWYRTLEPIIGAAFAVPRILLYPVLLAILGYGLQSKIGIGFLSAVFPIVVATMAGSREVAPILAKLATSMDMNPLQRFRKVLLPAAAPTVMAGLRMGIGSAFISVVVAEMVGAPSGLGVLVKKFYSALDLPSMYGVILLIVVIALAFNMALAQVEHRIRRSMD